MKVKQFHEESLGIIVGIISASFSTNKLARFCKLVLYRWRRRSRGLLMRRAEASVSCIITSSQCEHLYLFIVLSLCIYNFTLSIIDLCYDMLWYQICQFHPVYLKFRFFTVQHAAKSATHWLNHWLNSWLVLRQPLQMSPRTAWATAEIA